MRLSKLYLPTTRQRSRQAEIESHQLLLRAGVIKHRGPGLWAGLPMFQAVSSRLHRLLHRLFRELGAQEVAPTGLEALEDSEDARPFDAVAPDGRRYHLAPQPELEMASLLSDATLSYDALPLSFCASGTRLSTEPKVRFGLLQARRFDTFELSVFTDSEEAAIASERTIIDLLNQLSAALDLPARIAEAGDGCRWFLPVSTKAGFSEVLHAGNMVADPGVMPIRFEDRQTPEPARDLRKVPTPGASTIEQVSAQLKIEPGRIVKTIICVAQQQSLAVLIRGDRELSLPKLKQVLDDDSIRLAERQEIMELTGAPVGYAGPVGLSDLRIIADQLVKGMADFVVGANEDQVHYVNANHGRDFQVTGWADLNAARAGDLNPDGEELISVGGLSLARLKRLGPDTPGGPAILTRTADGEDVPCRQVHLSLGTSRLIQAVVELSHDGKGIIWPTSLAPYVVAVLPLKVDCEEHVEAANRIYQELAVAQIPVVLDDRPLRPGQKFADADLAGYPRRVVVGDKSLKDNAVEIQYRDDREARMISVEQAAGFLIKDLADTTL